MNAKHFAIGMADKRTRQRVRRCAWSIRSKIGRRHVHRFADAGVTDLAPIDDLVLANADLMAEDRVVLIGEIGFKTVDLRRRLADEMISKMVVALL